MAAFKIASETEPIQGLLIPTQWRALSGVLAEATG